MSHIVIVGADKGGVGKTTTSRAVLDYLASKEIETRAFDTETPKGVLKRFHSAAELVDLDRGSSGMMQVFDNLSKAPVSLIDVRAGLLTPTLDKLSSIGLLEAVQQGRMKLTMLHIIGSSVASFQEISGMAAVLAGAKHWLVMNHINEASFFSWNGDARAALKLGSGSIQIPKLDEMAMETVETMGISFPGFIDSSESMVLRGLVRNWLRMVFGQLEMVFGDL